MSKMSLDWHKECLKNQKSSLEREEERLKNYVDAVERQRRDYIIYKAKVDRAISEGRDGFDSDKFNVEKKKKKSFMGKTCTSCNKKPVVWINDDPYCRECAKGVV